ncbi:MAG: uracil-DNA glycosylase [Ignavibacteria bacterium]|nr:uracil-DNA glycosylase [Ignavibacteria bacterium]MCU7503620.1 uracil-DNA glycosylase [Ignavibacteria bacterium]MCU7516726.1 uracil-DNA glycosylase [Ignavibacteria bacterium]
MFENRRFEKIDPDLWAEALEDRADGEDSMENELDKEGFIHARNLTELQGFMLECHKCPLEKTRTNLVFGSGNPKAKVMVIGEAPGAEEDLQGKPFVGRAGKLLTDILAAIKFSRDEVYITNILKCRPPGNRNPLPSEMEVCIPYLHRQIEMIKPKLILCLGLISASGLLNLKLSLGKMRGNIYELGNAKVMVTYHPAALLRNPQWKRLAWEDVQKFRKLYDDMVG